MDIDNTLSFEEFSNYSDIIAKSPWYIRDSYLDLRISLAEALEQIEEDEDGIAIKINIYDAIKHIYGLSLVDLADFFDVSFGVMFHARYNGTCQKRLKQFSNKLCIPPHFFDSLTTHDLEQLEKCKEHFYDSHKDLSKISVPEWHEQLTHEIMKYFKCPIDVARKISHIDRLIWQPSFGTTYNEYELALINWTKKQAKKEKRDLSTIEYKLDKGANLLFYQRTTPF